MTTPNVNDDRKHRVQSGDRNNNYVADKDRPIHKERDKKIEEGEKKMDDLSKRDEGVR
ncbi:hypothetical protein IM816_11355 [Luteibacter flocculans]|uniref:Uncharacterized protein n=1 Tax=Luteibacter flocculans TaxID=2780091 RepID=A0ABY4SX05_9GAMM|nr:hypothetical protein [Luteibacter flocculans]URL57243.1 hypothetical protein IM816_11355 [Luteibacter flocculans]